MSQMEEKPQTSLIPVTCEEGYSIGNDRKTSASLDDDELEEEEELEVVRFPGLLFKSPPRQLHYVVTFLPPTYKDEEDEEEEEKDIHRELTALHKFACFPETNEKECGSICNCQNGSTCDLTGQCQSPPGVHGKTCEDDSPKGAYGAGCSSECQCVEENTLECSAKNGSCTCKSGYQATDARKMASGDQSAGSPTCPVKMEVSATEKLEVVTALLVTQENPVPYFQIHLPRKTQCTLQFIRCQPFIALWCRSPPSLEFLHSDNLLKATRGWMWLQGFLGNINYNYRTMKEDSRKYP
nr:EGF-like and EMI domain-containing protein 1 [Aotus nancymaae]